VALGKDADASQTTSSGLLAAQWHNPSKVLTVLLLLGPDVVQTTIAQLAWSIVTSVVFSFGWVAYEVA
jgi:hypothetical protein